MDLQARSRPNVLNNFRQLFPHFVGLSHPQTSSRPKGNSLLMRYWGSPACGVWSNPFLLCLSMAHVPSAASRSLLNSFRLPLWALGLPVSCFVLSVRILLSHSQSGCLTPLGYEFYLRTLWRTKVISGTPEDPPPNASGLWP